MLLVVLLFVMLQYENTELFICHVSFLSLDLYRAPLFSLEPLITLVRMLL